MTTAWVFPGQGSQTVGMGRDIAARYPAARAIFDEADEILGFSLSQLCWEGPEDELAQTVNSQPALVTTSIAQLVALRESGLLGEEPAFVAGHSLGEYTALVAAGSLKLRDALLLVRKRGDAMQAAGDATGEGSAMVAVIGADDAMLAEVCAAEGVDLANFNAPGQTTISGAKPAVDRVVETLKARGVRKMVPLAISMASHSRLMAPAAEAMQPYINGVELLPPSTPLIPNVSATPTTEPALIKQLLIAQLVSPVRWVDSIRYMADGGVTTIWEIGSGKILAGLIKRIAPEIEVIGGESRL